MGIQNKDTMVHVFIGPMGGGKNYQADEIIKKRMEQDKEYEFIGIDFGTELRQILWRTLNWSPEDSDDYMLFKEHYKIKVTDGNGNTLSELTGRQLLQRFGTEGVRTSDPFFWGKQLGKKILENKNKDVYVTDCRFDNEIMMVLSIPEVTPRFIFCNHKNLTKRDFYSVPNLQHKSEELSKSLVDLFSDGEDITEYILNNYEGQNDLRQYFLYEAGKY